jgi:uncharacterized protein
VSKGLPSREQAIQLLRENNCPPVVIRHCEAVADLALEIATKLQSKGLKINLELVQAGALLHDIGRSKTHKVNHGLIGSQIAKSEHLPESISNIIKRHVGGGITTEEATQFGWPKDNYMPQSIEEKVVSYSDKLIDREERVPIDLEIQRLSVGHKEAAEKVRKLHEEITNLLGN